MENNTAVATPAPTARYELVDASAAHDGKLSVEVSAERYNLGLAVGLPGYGLHDMEADTGAVIFIELYEGEPRLLVWADITSSEPTHVIPLGGASESKRLPD
jgi:hypothetical protein